MAKIIRTSDSRGPSLGAQRRAVETGSVDVLTAEMIALAESEAERIVDTSRTQADAILARAREQAQALQANAEAERDAAAADDTTRTREVLRSLREEIESKQRTWTKVHEGESLELAIAIAERIVRQHIDEDRQFAVIATREALHWVASAAKITVRLSLEDFDQHQEQIAELLCELHPAADCEVVSDASITPGGTRVDTEFGSIDQTVETQLDRVAEELRNV